MSKESRQQTELRDFIIENKNNKIIHQFSDLSYAPCVFDIKSERKFFTEFAKGNSKVIMYDGYLARKNDYGNIEYFHRFLFNKLDIKNKVIHHINMNKTDNRFGNLKIMNNEKHNDHHSNRSYWKAFGTWCEKTGHDNEDAFNEWLIEKQDNLDPYEEFESMDDEDEYY